VERVAAGFFNISGGAVDSSGDVYFVDAKWQTIYCWSAATRQLSVVSDHPLDPVQLVFDKAGDLMVVSSAGKGTVYSFRPGAQGEDITLLESAPTAPRPGMTPVLPVNYWWGGWSSSDALSVKRPYQFLSPDGSTFVAAGKDFVTGQLYYGSKFQDLLRDFGLAPAVAGQPFYITDGMEQKTYVGSVDVDGTISNLRLFVEQGGEGVTVDEMGNVYIAMGQVLVYDPSGHQIDTINVPERPSQLLFGGRDRNTLFILARGSLYAVQTRFRGR
jgi:sugar lactone lactonase YvrE